MSKIKQIYYDFNNSDEYSSLGEMSEVQDSFKQLKDYAKYFDKNEYIVLEEIVVANCRTNEMQGFVYGFQYAVQLLMECFPKNK